MSTRFRSRIARSLGAIGALAVALTLALGAPAAHASPTTSMTWTLPQQVSQLSFFQTIHSADARSAWYFGEQFRVGGQGAYMGLQPKAAGTSSSTIEVQAVFSVWGDVTSRASHCSSNADGDKGASCSTRFQLKKGVKYELRVDKAADGAWVGTVKDTSSGSTVAKTGWWKIAGTGDISASNLAWTERYIDGYNCDTIPYFDVTFGHPTGNNGAVKGSMGAPREGSPCQGEQNWKSSTSSAGHRISAGKG